VRSLGGSSIEPTCMLDSKLPQLVSMSTKQASNGVTTIFMV